MDGDRPLAAFILSLIAAILMLFEGVALLAAGSILGGAGYQGAAVAVGLFGALGVLFGIIALILSLALLAVPEFHRGIGILLIVVSLLSFFGGGGFFLGIVLGFIGGILAIVYNHEDSAEDFDVFAAERQREQMAAAAQWAAANSPRATAAAAPVPPPPSPTPSPIGPTTPCTHCGKPVPVGAVRCGACGNPVRNR